MLPSPKAHCLRQTKEEVNKNQLVKMSAFMVFSLVGLFLWVPTPRNSTAVLTSEQLLFASLTVWPQRTILGFKSQWDFKCQCEKSGARLLFILSKILPQYFYF
jgi:hypothetical protein